MAIVLPKLPRVRTPSSESVGAAPALTIDLCRQDGQYVAGQSIEIDWRLTGGNFLMLDRVELSVLWQTEGKGDEDLHVHHFQSWNETQLKQLDLSDRQSVACSLPASPLSYDGTLLRIRWFVRMRVYHNDGRDFSCQVPFRLSGIEFDEPTPDGM